MNTSHRLLFAMALAMIMPMVGYAIPEQNSGVFHTLIDENFSLFTEGTPEVPASETLIVSENILGTIPDQYTQMPGWRGALVFSAGGCAFIDLYHAPAQTLSGILITPYLENNNRNAFYIVTLKAKTASGKDDFVDVTYSYGSGSGIDYGSLPVSADWQDLEYMFSADEDYEQIYFTISSNKEQLLVDDVKVQLYEPYLHAPQVEEATDFDGGSFVANWLPVENAASYLLSVFSIENNVRDYLFVDKEVEGTSYKVDGLDPEKGYWYVVKAKNDQYTSPESKAMSVSAIVAPVMNDAENVTNNGFTASWNAVPRATHYEFWAYQYHKAVDSEDYILTDERFSKVHSTGSVANPEVIYDMASESLDEYMAQPGWVLYAPVHIDGAIGMDASFYLSGIPCYLMSPEFDLSQGEGTVTVEFRAYVSDTESTGHQTIPVVSMLNRGTGETPETVDQEQIEDITPGVWQSFSVSLAKGTKTASVMIFPYGNAGYLFIDNLKVVKHLESGESILLPVCYEFTTETSVDVSAEKPETDSFAFKARAFRIQGNDFLSSSWSELKYTDPDASVAGIEFKKPVVYVTDGILSVENPTGAAIAVYMINGVKVDGKNAGFRQAEIRLPEHGIYIVKVGSDVVKVVY